jgi:membrane protease YdiL (CAAX protease family)
VGTAGSSPERPASGRGIHLGAVGIVCAFNGRYVLVGIMHGKTGVGRLLGRLLKWRVGLRWHLVVLIIPLLAPLALGLSILLGGRASTVDFSIIAVIGMFVFSIFPGSALGEEVGWRGFALSHLQDGQNALIAALDSGRSGEYGTCRCG